MKALLEAGNAAYGGNMNDNGFKVFINAQSNLGFTPINNCARAANQANIRRTDYDSILRLLIQYGADSTIPNKCGWDPKKNYPEFNWPTVDSRPYFHRANDNTFFRRNQISSMLPAHRENSEKSRPRYNS